MSPSTGTIWLLAAMMLVSHFAAPAARAQSENPTYVTLPVNVSLVPGVSVGDAVASASGSRVINNVAISILAGRAAGLRGVEWAGLASMYSEDVRGVQFAGLANLVRGSAVAAQFGGLLNVVSGDARVAQFGGALNITGASAQGAQFGGAVNLASEDFAGAQFAGGVNVVGGDFRGAQFGGIANVVGRRSSGLQMGPVNVAPEVTGVQIGVVNVARRHQGVPIGLVSYVQDVGLQFDVWAAESGMLSASLRTGNRSVANHFGLAVAPFGDDLYLGVLAGLGVEGPIARGRARATVDLLAYGLYHDRLEHNWLQLSTARATVAMKVVDRLEVFGGPTFNVLIADEGDQDVGIAPWTVYEYTSSNVHLKLWPGIVAGVRVR